MAQNILLNGITYTIPDTAETGWGDNLTDFFVAIPQGVLQKTGGLFTLTADVNFGASFGLLVAYLKSRSSDIATAGIIRLARTDGIVWRNAANDGNLILTVDGSDTLLFNGNAFVISGFIVNADIAADAAIARSKLASGTASHVLINDGSGVMSSEAALAKVRGGSGQDNSSLTFPASGTLVTESGTQTLTNKTIGDAATYTQVSTPSNPSSGNNKLYFKSDDNLYILDSSGNETTISAFGPQADNTVFAGPTSSGPSAPTFRALVGADIPTATQSDQETATSTTVFVTPGRQQYHPSAAKAWIKCDISAGVNASYNVSSVTDVTTGAVDVNWNIDFSSTNYVPVATLQTDSALICRVTNTPGPSAGTTRVVSYNTSGTLTDPDHYFVTAFGDQS